MLSRTVAIVFGTLAFITSAESALVFGQIDDFEGGTTQNWLNGGAGAPAIVNVSTGGPAGLNDNFIQVTSTGTSGGAAGSRLTAFNRTQWLGDYIGQGVNAIAIDLRNFSTTVTLSIRLAFKTDLSQGGSGYLSAPFVLGPSSGWQHAVFSITPGTMTTIGAPASFNIFFANGMAEFRIINEALATNLTGDVVAAQLGVDNIQGIPEPQTVSLITVSLVLSLLLRRRSRA